MARTHGRAPKGERCRAPVPHGHWKTTTFVGALTLGGMTAPWVIDGAMDGEMFLLWVQTQLAPVLRPGDMVILENLPAHKPTAIRPTAIREVIEAAGAVPAFLPPYSPDFNPIELAFSKLKAWLRNQAARTKEALDHAIAAGVERITQADCRSSFAATEYETEWSESALDLRAAVLCCTVRSIKMPQETKKIGNWLSSKQAIGYNLSVKIFGTGGGVGRQVNLSDPQSASFEAIKDTIECVAA